MAALSEIGYFVASYLAIILLTIFLLNWQSGGFLTQLYKVKLSRGRKILVKVHSKLSTYAVPGWFEGGELVFFDRESKANKQKTPKRIVIKDRNVFYRFSGVYAVDFDEATNSLFKHDAGALSGFDAIMWNNLYVRALMKPAPDKAESTLIIICLILIGLCVLLLIVVLVRQGQLTKAISLIRAAPVSVGGVNV